MKLCIQSARKQLACLLPLRQSTKPIQNNICHIGMGNFHRAHLANYIHQLNCLQESQQDQYWAIRGIGIKPQDQQLNVKLSQQDYIYTHKQAQSSKFTFIQSIRSIKTVSDSNLDNYQNEQDIFNEIASPQTKILSLTITQGGYNIDDITGQFNLSNQDIIHDIKSLSGEKQSVKLRTVFAYFYKGIEYRMKNNNQHSKLTVMSCDNVQQNGKVCEYSFKSFINAVNNKEIIKYLEQNVVFVNSMVDRITPVAPVQSLRREIQQKFGVIDNCPILTQQFTQFVIQDKFINNIRPQFERVGVQIVNDVAPYQKMKLRLLNAAHSLLAYTGVLCGYKYAHQGAQDVLIRRFLEEFMDIDATPSLEGGPKTINLKQYKKKLIERFSSQQIKDTLARLCLQGSDRIPKFVLPSLLYHLKNNKNLKSSDLKRYAFHFAAYARYLCNDQEINKRASIQNYIIDDKISQQLAKTGRQIYNSEGSQSGSMILSVQKIFGDDLQIYPSELKDEIDRQYLAIKQLGARDALNKMLNE